MIGKINKIAFLFFLVLCFAAANAVLTVSAQTGADKVLIAGKKPLKQSDVAALLEFYEWIFDAEFTAAERERFESFVKADYRRDPAAFRRNADEVVRAFAKVRALDAAGQRKTRELAAPGFVADLRKTAEDADSQFLLGIYERAQAGENGTISTRAASAENDSRARQPRTGGDGLHGKWFRSTGGSSIDPTGKTRYGGGTRYTFEFFPDGTVEYVEAGDTLSIMLCRIKSEKRARGKATINGGSMTMDLGAMSWVGTNSCDKKENFNKTLSASSLTVKFEIKKMDSIFRPDSPTILCFDGAGDDGCFERTTD